MLLFSLILLFLIILIYLLFIIPLKINFIFDTNNEEMNITMLWLDPFLKTKLFMESNKTILEVFLFNKNIVKKALKPKNPKSGIRLVKNIKFNDINLTAYYGFRDKFATGVASGFFGLISQFLQIDLEQNPDFSAIEDYIYINADASIKIMPTIKGMAKQKFL